MGRGDMPNRKSGDRKRAREKPSAAAARSPVPWSRLLRLVVLFGALLGCVEAAIVVVCLPLWVCLHFAPLPARANSVIANVITTAGAWLGARQWIEQGLPHNDHWRLCYAMAVGILMGSAYRALWRVCATTSASPRDGDGGLDSGRAGHSTDHLRPSITVPLDGAADRGGRVASTAPPNAHGNRVFAVKVCLPILGANKRTHRSGLDGLGMIYDQDRTFQCFVNLESDAQPEMAGLVRQIARDGAAGGTKGYFEARRSGDVLRVFVDRMLEPPRW